MEKPVLVVLAAGMGSRYGGLKQMDSVGGYGQSLIDYSAYDAKRAGFETAVFVIGRAMEADFRESVGARVERGMEVRYAFQSPEDLARPVRLPPGRKKPLGAAHAALAARKVVNGPFAVINADDYYGPEAYRAVYAHLSAHAGSSVHAMAGYRLGLTLSDYGGVNRGICRVSPEGLLERIDERMNIERDGDGGKFSPDGGKSWEHLPGDTLVSMNFWGFQRSFLEEAEASFPALLDRALEKDPERGEVQLPPVVEDLLRRGRARVRVLPCAERWFGVTHREDKPAVVRSLREKTERGLYPENLWGV